MEDSLGERLRSAREYAGLSQSELARQVGLSPQAIQHIESDKTVRTRYVNQIAGVLGVAALWLESGQGPREIERREYVLPAPDVGRVVTAKSVVAFPEAEIAYRRETIPVFVASQLRKKEKSDLEIGITRDIAECIENFNYKKFDTAELDELINGKFFRLTDGQADDIVPRPANLLGQNDAYGLYLDAFGNQTLSGRMSLADGIIHISPYKRPTYGDMIVIWHRTNSFVLGLLGSEDSDLISIQSEILSRKFPSADVWSLDDENRRALVFNKIVVKSVHTVVGIEFTMPRSKKVFPYDGKTYLRADEVYRIG